MMITLMIKFSLKTSSTQSQLYKMPWNKDLLVKKVFLLQMRLLHS